jgi:hypothetical protein
LLDCAGNEDVSNGKKLPTHQASMLNNRVPPKDAQLYVTAFNGKHKLHKPNNEVASKGCATSRGPIQLINTPLKLKIKMLKTSLQGQRAQLKTT